VGKMFGYSNAKSSLDAVFGTGADRHENILFGTNGVISRTLTHWESVIRDLFDLVDKLRAEIVKMREELERARDEWKRQREEMEREKLAAEQKAKADAMAAERKAQAEAVAAAEKARGLEERFNAAREALEAAEACKRIARKARAQRSVGITPGERLQRRRMPMNRTGLTRDRTVRVRSKAATDSVGMSRSSNSRRRATTQEALDELIRTAGPVHQPDEECPDKNDTVAYNDYRARVSAVRARAWECGLRVRVRACVGDGVCVCVVVCARE